MGGGGGRRRPENQPSTAPHQACCGCGERRARAHFAERGYGHCVEVSTSGGCSVGEATGGWPLGWPGGRNSHHFRAGSQRGASKDVTEQSTVGPLGERLTKLDRGKGKQASSYSHSRSSGLDLARKVSSTLALRVTGVNGLAGTLASAG